MTFIYEQIATKYNTNVDLIEAAIRRIIEYTFRFGNLIELNKLFAQNISHISTIKVNKKYFILKVAKYVQNEKN